MNELCGRLSPKSGMTENAVEICKRCGRGTTFPELYKKEEAIVIAPGYELSRTKSNIAVHLCDEFFNRIQPLKPFASREQLVTDLQKQIAELVNLLEQESIKQMSIVNRFQTEGREASLAMQRKHEEELRKILEMHALEIEEQQSKFAAILASQKQKAEKKYYELKNQFQNLQAAFISFKESIIEEINERLAQKERELNEKHEIEMKRELALQRNALQRKCDEEKQAIVDSYEQQIDAILNQHKGEMDGAAQQYSAIMDTVDELRNAKEQIKDLLQQLEKKNEEIRNQSEYLSFLEAELAYDRAKLAEIEGTYKSNIGSMKRKYVTSIKALEDQNLDLKQLFSIKAEELCALKAMIEERERIDQLERTNIQQ
ncbi:flagellum-associated coiled-coil domain-containing protein 1-like isoform X2 [Stegostoma tigrinum]|uniref:flagellum-associated coiled-coil domain-containing protein 1-like isoform X2 n=1 Tax=Stegostoma tigrinum TaxID=3053191 RepID=UPI00202ACA0C|nr:flagellum-associated coiled-coil domain-containing protein 1-like isoform X2 [Stegostoma tigrinum]